MSLIRSLAVALAFGALLILVDVMLDGAWPERSPASWLVLVAGFVVIGLAFHVAEAVYRSRSDR